MFSGAAGLIYEVTWARQLGLILGNTARAAAVVLTAFFAGLAAGSWLGGLIVQRLSRPMRGYAFFELMVAAWAPVVPLILAFVARSSITGNPALSAAVAFAVLLPGTVALGATLPVVAQQLADDRRRIPAAYAFNLVGAVIGAVAATFFLIEALGVSRTAFIAAGVSAGCGLAAFFVPNAASHSPKPKRARARWLVVAFVSGFGALALQVLYTRMFALTFHNSAYSFGAVIVAFLLALSIGSAVAPRLAARLGSHGAIGFSCLATAVFVPLSVLAFAAITRLEYLDAGNNFVQYVGAALALTFSVIAPSVVMLGVVLPAVWLAANPQRWRQGRVVGALTAVNTLAAAAGAAFAAFVALPAIGLWGSFAVVSGLYAVMGLAFAVYRWPARSALVTVIVVVSWFAARPDPKPGGVALVRWETAYGWLDVVRDGDTQRMRLNLHNELSNSISAPTDRRMGHLPLLMHPGPKRALFLGLATGITASAALWHDEVESITVVELIPEVVEAAAYFGIENRGLLVDPRTRVVVDDARHFLLRDTGKYDVIVGDLYVPWQEKTGYLYTLEHFQAVAGRLENGGVFCQWLPMWQLGRNEFLSIADTFADVFPTVTVWRADLSAKRPRLALCGALEIRQFDVREMDRRRQVEPDDYFLSDLERLLWLYTGRWKPTGATLNTDDFPTVEFSAPRSQRAGDTLTGNRLRTLYDTVFRWMPAISEGFDKQLEQLGGAVGPE